MIAAKVVADSISTEDVRLTTMVLTYPRFIHAEFMTHRMFSRNASSSRALPVQRTLDEVSRHPAMPLYWGKNQAGMQARQELAPEQIDQARKVIDGMRDATLLGTQRLHQLDLHKQVANRYAEPWSHITVICTATEWDNFYSLRCHPDAQPEMRALAEAMLEAHNASSCVRRNEFSWHLPFVTGEERTAYSLWVVVEASVARCARVSYLNHDGSSPDIEKDRQLYRRLHESGHFSPFEHQAHPAMGRQVFYANFRRWTSLRSGSSFDRQAPFPGLKKPTVIGENE